jgi:hypothetical protein
MVYPFKAIKAHNQKYKSHEKDETTEEEGSYTSAPDLIPSGSGSGSGSTCVVPASIVAQPHTKKRFMLIDETSLPPEEAERLLMKRAYNRECADRARKRGKQLVSDLEQQVHDLQEDKNELRRSVAVMEKQLMKLQQENQLLLSKTRGVQQDNIPSHIPGMSVDTVTGLRLYPQQQPNLSALQQMGNYTTETLLQSLDYQKWLLLQQLRD